jgi:hypothetical protein
MIIDEQGCPRQVAYAPLHGIETRDGTAIVLVASCGDTADVLDLKNRDGFRDSGNAAKKKPVRDGLSSSMPS